MAREGPSTEVTYEQRREAREEGAAGIDLLFPYYLGSLGNETKKRILLDTKIIVDSWD